MNRSPLSQRFYELCNQKPLGLRLLAAILLYSSVITLVATATQLWLDYRYERSAIEERLQQIEASSLNSLANSLWEISPTQIQVQLDGILQLPDVHYLALKTPFDDQYTAGHKPQVGAIVERHYPLNYTDSSNQAVKVGDLTLIVSLDEVYRR
ncbi:histidine kinase, partial [Amphritea sp. 1_MG-2023]|nr:histidine kinase [Amphritea sp. 1_MG-2023]